MASLILEKGGRFEQGDVDVVEGRGGRATAVSVWVDLKIQSRGQWKEDLARAIGSHVSIRLVNKDAYRHSPADTRRAGDPSPTRPGEASMGDVQLAISNAVAQQDLTAVKVVATPVGSILGITIYTDVAKVDREFLREDITGALKNLYPSGIEPNWFLSLREGTDIVPDAATPDARKLQSAVAGAMVDLRLAPSLIHVAPPSPDRPAYHVTVRVDVPVPEAQVVKAMEPDLLRVFGETPPAFTISVGRTQRPQSSQPAVPAAASVTLPESLPLRSGPIAERNGDTVEALPLVSIKQLSPQKQDAAAALGVALVAGFAAVVPSAGNVGLGVRAIQSRMAAAEAADTLEAGLGDRVSSLFALAQSPWANASALIQGVADLNQSLGRNGLYMDVTIFRPTTEAPLGRAVVLVFQIEDVRQIDIDGFTAPIAYIAPVENSRNRANFGHHPEHAPNAYVNMASVEQAATHIQQFMAGGPYMMTVNSGSGLIRKDNLTAEERIFSGVADAIVRDATPHVPLHAVGEALAASVARHEAFHVVHGPSEKGAYALEIASAEPWLVKFRVMDVLSHASGVNPTRTREGTRELLIGMQKNLPDVQFLNGNATATNFQLNARALPDLLRHDTGALQDAARTALDQFMRESPQAVR